MQRLVKYSSTVSSLGTYAAINAYPSTIIPPTGVQLNVPSILAAGSLVAFANVGASAGVVVPVYLGADGNYYPLANPTTVSASGFLFAFQMSAPAPGLAIQITTAITGTVNLFCSAVLV